MSFVLILIQVVQAVVTARLWRAVGRRAALTGCSFLEDSDQVHLGSTPQEDVGEGLSHEGYAVQPASRSP
ncbi:unnamed protein product [Tetraodon nigroviridis]|nr:unnamed protein product [Tetraodon nigroviridis]